MREQQNDSHWKENIKHPCLQTILLHTRKAQESMDNILKKKMREFSKDIKLTLKYHKINSLPIFI